MLIILILYINNFSINSDLRNASRHYVKQDSSQMTIDEPSTSSIEMDEEPSTSAIGTDSVPSTSAIATDEVPSTSEHLMDIDDKDREAYRISELHEYDYYEQMERYQAEERNREEEEEEEEIASDVDDDYIEIPYIF